MDFILFYLCSICHSPWQFSEYNLKIFEYDVKILCIILRTCFSLVGIPLDVCRLYTFDINCMTALLIVALLHLYQVGTKFLKIWILLYIDKDNIYGKKLTNRFQNVLKIENTRHLYYDYGYESEFRCYITILEFV